QEDTQLVPLPPPMAELDETVAEGLPVITDEEDGTELVPGTVAIPARVRRLDPGELLPLALEPRPEWTAVHHVDPLSSGARRGFLRGRKGEEHVVEVMDGPAPDRVLPIRLRSTNR